MRLKMLVGRMISDISKEWSPYQDDDLNFKSLVIEKLEKEMWVDIKRLCKPLIEAHRLKMLSEHGVHKSGDQAQNTVNFFLDGIEKEPGFSQTLAFLILRACWGEQNRRENFEKELTCNIVCGVLAWKIHFALPETTRRKIRYGYALDFPASNAKGNSLILYPEQIMATFRTLMNAVKAEV